ncbi:MAG: ABC transporter ATP-binding protein [Candidatus Odinarchaeota archaeon]
MTVIQMENVEKRFGKELVIPDMNLTIKDKEFLVLVGPSGCGKSTMLNLIAGLEYPTGGRIEFDGKDVTFINPKERNVAMVFQSYALYPHMKTYDNLSFGLKLAKMDKKEIDERVRRAAKILQIEELLEKKPRQMSGGQRQRVALGRAIVRNPSVFLLDEPLSNLDAKLRVEMRAEIIRLQKQLETTLVYVTHDQVEAMSMADRIAIINKGRIQQLGSPFDVYNYPDNVFVAGFIGSPSMNFLPGKIVQEGSSVFVDFALGKLKLAKKRAEAAQAYLKMNKSDVIVGVRPEHLFLGHTEAETETLEIEEDEMYERAFKSSENVVTKGEVFVVEHLGAGTYTTLEVGGQRIGVMVDGYLDTRIGNELYLRAYDPMIHLFDNETNESILLLLKE